jgi:hypothetical protein
LSAVRDEDNLKSGSGPEGEKMLISENRYLMFRRAGTRWIILIFGTLGALSVWLCVSIWSSTREAPFPLSVMTNSANGPIALFTQHQPPPLKFLPITGMGSSSRMWVFRHGQWTELGLGEVSRRVRLDPVVTTHSASHNYARFGNSLWIDVPVCEAWKIEETIFKTIRIGPKFLGLTYGTTNVLESPELPGWSNIRRAFRSEPKGAHLKRR